MVRYGGDRVDRVDHGAVRGVHDGVRGEEEEVRDGS